MAAIDIQGCTSPPEADDFERGFEWQWPALCLASVSFWEATVMRVLFTDRLALSDEFTRAFRPLSPSTLSYHWPHLPADGEFDLLVSWKLPDEAPPLPKTVRAVFCFGAGADQLLSDPRIPAHLPIARLEDVGQAKQILDYAAHAAFARLQDDDIRRTEQRAGIWRHAPGQGKRRDELQVTVLGLGPIGETVARGLADIGFTTVGWSRTARSLDGVRSHFGQDGLRDAVSGADVLINLLPLQVETANILDRSLFALVAPGAYLVNLGRGGHLHEEDLLAGLDTGAIGCAWLDVYRQEPLPRTHCFWDHPRIRMTPHLAGVPTPEGAARSVSAVIKALEDGAPLPGLVRPPAK